MLWVARGAEGDDIALSSIFGLDAGRRFRPTPLDGGIVLFYSSFLDKPQTTDCAWHFREAHATSGPSSRQPGVSPPPVPFLFSSYSPAPTVEPTFQPCDNLVATEASRHPCSFLSSVTNACFALCASAGPRASALSAAIFLFPTHPRRRRDSAQGYHRPVLCRLIGFGLTFVC